MKALSIQQPWAWAILYAGKDVENRTWAHNYRGSFLIHTGKRFDHEAYSWLFKKQPQLFPDVRLPLKNEFLLGGIVGKAVIVRLIRSKCYSPWMFGPWGWVLAQPQPLEFFPCNGSLGFFDIVYRDENACMRA